MVFRVPLEAHLNLVDPTDVCLQSQGLCERYVGQELLAWQYQKTKLRIFRINGKVMAINRLINQLIEYCWLML